ncbi:MAG: ABC transporter ATP-binding protein [Flavobacteriaceae bacterium]|nr:ABC transporter ATP-binding protein [Flavobacteriaceae bacterium]
MLNLIVKISSLLTYSEKKSLIVLSFFIIVGMILEVFGLGILVPLLTLILDPEFINTLGEYGFIQNIFGQISHYKFIAFFLVFVVIIYIIKTIFLIFITFKQNSFITKFAADLTIKLYDLYINQPYSFHLNRNSASLIKNLQVEINLFRSFCMSIITSVIELALLISIIGTLIFIEPIGAIFVGFFFFAFSFLIFQITKSKLKSWGIKRENLDEKIQIIFFEGIGGIKDLKILGRQDFYKNLLSINSYSKARIITNHLTISKMPRYSLELISVLGIAIFISIMLFQDKEVSEIIITLGVFVAATFRMIPSFNKLIASLQNMKYYTSSIELIFKEFNKFKKIKGLNKSNKAYSFNSKIEIKDLKYSYSKESKEVLKNVNLTISKGEFIGIVGASGSGKSTLVDLIMGLLTPSKGSINIDGININANPSSWQRLIGYVPQSIFLIDDSITNNIAFGIPPNKINNKKIEDSVNDSQLKKYIDGLKNGLQTKVGERGIQISGGQLQRIGIARALYNSPEIIILDESTASLDIKTELEVMESIKTFKRNKTILMISHRISSLKDCDHIYEIKNGKIYKFKKNA